MDLVVEEIGLPSTLKILGKISQGGIGAVFRAEDSATGAQLAVKVLLPQLAAIERHRKRFIQEARTICSLSNPHIVAVHECGVSESGLPYMVMDYIDGLTLDQLLGQNTVSVEEAIDIFVQTAEAVGLAHKAGIIHRDLKPSNIMLCRQDDGRYFVKVLDFGIAKVTEESNIQHTLANLTATGELLGTPSYMSPEQSLGLTIDHRTDIYSFGCVMCHVLTGKPPFTAASALQLLAKQTIDRAPEIKKLRPDLKIPRGLDKIVEKSLEKKPADRYQNMDELLADLGKVKRGASIPTRLTGSQKQYMKLMVNIVVWFSVFYLAGRFLPGVISYFQSHMGGQSQTETSTSSQP
jgi:serine/threonine-protein kinase